MVRHTSSKPFFRVNMLFALAAVLLFPAKLISRDPGPVWHSSYSPVRTNLTAVVMLSPSEGYAAGKYLLRCTSGRWEMVSGLPWTSSVNAIHALSSNALYAATVEETNESVLYFYDGKRWTRRPHPLANFITAIALDAEGRGWLGGWGEFARFDGRQWKRYPPTPGVSTVRGIVGADEQELRICTEGFGVFRFRNDRWEQEIAQDTLSAFTVLGPNSAAAVCRSVLWVWNGTAWYPHSADPQLDRSVTVRLSPGGVWFAVGMNGMLLRYGTNGWQKVPVPVRHRLNDIALTGSTAGWIVGENGTILSTDPVSQSPDGAPAGFRSVQVFQSGKGLEGEYGVAFEDVNGDGKDDLYTVSLYNQNLLFINQTEQGGEVQFRDETVLRNAAGGEPDTSLYSTRDIDQGIGIADIDNDGDRDLILCSLVGHNSLFLNRGDGYFLDVSHQHGPSDVTASRTNSAAFADADNDGDLEMFTANENGSNLMFENDGNGYFRDITRSAGLLTEGGGVGSTFGDVDGDGKSDLVVTSWNARCRLYRNVSDASGIRFEDVTVRSGIGGAPYERSNGAVFGDIDNDGDLDLVIAKRKGAVALFLNDGSGVFTDIAPAALSTDTLITYGVALADLNNDGWQDLYLSNVGTNRLYINNGNRTFTDRTYEYGVQHTGYNTGVVTGDVERDGDLDLYAATYINGESRLFVNGLNDRRWITVAIEGTRSNRDGVGARVSIHSSGKTGKDRTLIGLREVTSGSGYASHPSLTVHFGLPDEGAYDVVVHFPASGISRTLSGVRAGTHLLVREETGAARSTTLAARSLQRMLIDPSMQREAMMAGMVALLLGGSIRWGRRRSGWGAAQLTAFHLPVALLYGIISALLFYDRSLTGRWLPLFLVTVYFALLHLYYERVVLVRTALREKEETRRQIARDLHDDIASTLSSATIYLNILKRSLRRPTLSQSGLLAKVDDAIGSASEGMTDIVWAIAPKHDTLGDLVTRIRMMVSETAGSHGSTAAFNIGEITAAAPVSDTVRRNIYLIMKEAVRNSCTHSHGDRIEFAVMCREGRTSFVLSDNGRGVDAAAAERPADDVLHGHGLSNMLSRAQEIGAEFSIAPGSAGGTVVTVSIEMTHLHH